ncbi:unnamed protein product [Fusarium venenatum]|uniref:Uncharacterized protein n=1 Tax=Fusarium venenatum TaxID=56646 RepID=A0A2L2SQJ5_9HYPO|nr:uncharacterized protein FVRRES_11732 [Fusarium venenatum]CEI39041.1 unnamed protein product [Fusarium venenatum]
MGRAASKALQRTTHSSSQRFQASHGRKFCFHWNSMKGAYSQPIMYPKPNWDLRVAEQEQGGGGGANGRGVWQWDVATLAAPKVEDLNLNHWR